MNRWGRRSMSSLSTCHKILQAILTEALEIMNITVLEGHRGERKQNYYFERGFSRVKYPNGRHNKYPSEAVDVSPWPIVYPNLHKFVKKIPPNLHKDFWKKVKAYARIAYMAGIIVGIAKRKGVTLVWGGDWDGDGELSDNRFDDLWHLQIKKMEINGLRKEAKNGKI